MECSAVAKAVEVVIHLMNLKMVLAFSKCQGGQDTWLNPRDPVLARVENNGVRANFTRLFFILFCSDVLGWQRENYKSRVFFCAYNIRSLLLRKFLKNSLAHLIHSKAKRDADIMKVMAHIWNAVRSQRRLKL